MACKVEDEEIQLQRMWRSCPPPGTQKAKRRENQRLGSHSSLCKTGSKTLISL